MHLAPSLAIALLFLGAAAARSQECVPTLHDLRRMRPGQLEALFRSAAVGTPLVGNGRGRLLCSTDPRHPRLQVLTTNAVWKGKIAEPDGHFINRWLGGIRAIGSQYTIGPSWLDGRDALVVEYAPGTPLLANSRDELREVAPGLYIGPLYERCPCPVLRGFLAVEVDRCR